MSDGFAQRLRALGLSVPESEIAPLERMVMDLEAAAKLLRVPRPVAQEPVTVFRLEHPVPAPDHAGRG
ncbi:hypothetical protein [Teichococcus aestuarii]|uniref:DUF4089 domain-containing protein n=1 Tax=Teichococcus aestuarii TaxID=568898 RepID=A0A2U1V3Q7_9PROT|nr:hypothetical protein [Pseudoroseomonas aestuarii]PWC28513.1 hypothetical protein CR165_12535 [Pseudoroseomonas aestuarii]